DGGPEDEGCSEVEEGGPDDRLAGRQYPGGHDGCDRMGGCVKAVNVVENQRNRDYDGDESEFHVSLYPCLTTTPSSTLAQSSQRSVASSRRSSISFHLMTERASF